MVVVLDGGVRQVKTVGEEDRPPTGGLRPTMGLRFRRQQVGYFRGDAPNGVAIETILVLQQLYVDEGGQEVWLDVPEEAEA
jgi:hypothetical protein